MEWKPSPFRSRWHYSSPRDLHMQCSVLFSGDGVTGGAEPTSELCLSVYGQLGCGARCAGAYTPPYCPPRQSLQAISSRKSSTSTLLHPTNHITPETIFHIVTSSQLKMGTREASHAGSWYEDDAGELSSQLDNFLGQVPATLDEHSLPVPGARVIIAP